MSAPSTSKKDLFILGTGGLAREIALFCLSINKTENKWAKIWFVKNSEDPVDSLALLNIEVFGTDAQLLDSNMKGDVVVGAGSPKVRRKMVEPYLNMRDRFSFPNICHPNSFLDAEFVSLGEGNFITPGCVFTCNIHIGDFNYFNLNVTVGHDSQISDYCVVNPGANISGGVKLGSSVLVGTGAQILQYVEVENDAVIGAGAVVNNKVSAATTVVGIPAKPLAKK